MGNDESCNRTCRTKKFEILPRATRTQQASPRAAPQSCLDETWATSAGGDRQAAVLRDRPRKDWATATQERGGAVRGMTVRRIGTEASARSGKCRESRRMYVLCRSAKLTERDPTPCATAGYEGQQRAARDAAHCHTTRRRAHVTWRACHRAPPSRTGAHLPSSKGRQGGVATRQGGEEARGEMGTGH